MFTEIEYQFDSEPFAYRFLNSVKSWHQIDLKAEYGKDSSAVRVTYKMDRNGFDDTLSRLDDLALKYGGKAD